MKTLQLMLLSPAIKDARFPLKALTVAFVFFSGTGCVTTHMWKSANFRATKVHTREIIAYAVDESGESTMLIDSERHALLAPLGSPERLLRQMDDSGGSPRLYQISEKAERMGFV